MTQAAKSDCIPIVPILRTKRILCSVCSYPRPSDAVPLQSFDGQANLSTMLECPLMPLFSCTQIQHWREVWAFQTATTSHP